MCLKSGKCKCFTYNGSLVAVFIKMLIDVLGPRHVIRDKNIWVLTLKRHGRSECPSCEIAFTLCQMSRLNLDYTLTERRLGYCYAVRLKQDMSR